MPKIIQVIFIHGGMTFKSHRDYLRYLKTKKAKLGEINYWSGRFLTQALGRKFQITRPRMPQQDDAKYAEWKIAFERYVPLLKNNVILIGASLGGIFLAKYLSEHKFPKKLLSVYLVCTPFDHHLPTEDLVGGFRLKKDLSLLQKNCKNLYLLFSKDDDVVPVSHAAKYAKALPQAKIIIYRNKKGHFYVRTFPEIVKLIKNDVKNRS